MSRMMKMAYAIVGSTLSCVSAAQAATVTIGSGGEFRIDGEPFLPIMQWLQSSSRIEYQSSLGINTFVGNGGNNTSAEYLAECRAQGVWCVMDPADMSVSSDPALLGWIFGDEPDLASNAVEPMEIQTQYDSIKQADPNHVTLLTLTSGFFGEMEPPDWMNGDRSRYYEYGEASDAVGFDLYPVYGWCRPDWLDYVGASQDELASEYAPNRATYQWIECVRTSSQWCDIDERKPDDGPTPVEVSNEVWQAIVHGAKAIGYFTHSWECPDYTQFCLSTEQEAGLERTNAQLTALTVPILSAPYEETVTVEPSSTDRIDWTTRRVGDEVTLIAVNLATSTVDVSFDVPGLVPDAAVSVHDEDRSLTPVGESFADSFDPLAVHIYRMPVAPAAGAGGTGNDSMGGSPAAGSSGLGRTGTGGTSGRIDTSGDTAGVLGRAENTAEGNDEGGCGCATPNGRVGRVQASLLAVLTLCAWRRRRRRARADRSLRRTRATGARQVAAGRRFARLSRADHVPGRWHR